LTLDSLIGETSSHPDCEQWQLERELQLARSVQRSLLPSSDPGLPGYDIASWSQPAAATGGDFYDYVDLSDGRLGLVVADVAGHGLAASLLACETRALIRSAALSARSLVDIVTSTNALLYRDLHHERFVTLFIGALEVSTGRVEFVAAGCMPMAYRPLERRVLLLEATIPPLGITSLVPHHAATTITLQDGDVMAVVTDGFYEWEDDARQPFGVERVGESVRTHSSRSAAQLIWSLHRDVQIHAQGVKQADDLTAMVVKRLPLPSG
jgi:serine phosphatase RsbU (regulator of sigma subunit)